jgi:hypothetical protein
VGVGVGMGGWVSARVCVCVCACAYVRVCVVCVRVRVRVRVVHRTKQEAEFLRNNNPYHILGLESTCSQSAIRKAFRALSLQHHPDKNLDDPQAAQEMFQKISQVSQPVSQPASQSVSHPPTHARSNGVRASAR